MITKNINSAITALINDDIIAMPTETVYGLAGNAFSDTAIKKIFLLKKRPFYNPLIIHTNTLSKLNTIASDIPQKALHLAASFWPGPLTMVLKKQPHISDLITAGKETVAVRVPNHPVALKLIEKLDFPLAAPSANPFGSISPTRAEHVQNYFKKTLKIILDGGECERGVESTIIGFEGNTPVLFRHGSITLEELEQVVGAIKVQTNNKTNPDAPGMLSHHYSPTTYTYLTNKIVDSAKRFKDKKIGLLTFKEELPLIKTEAHEILSKSGNLKEAAKNLYGALHSLDKANVDIIIAQRVPNNGLGRTINDRLEKAARNK